MGDKYRYDADMAAYRGERVMTTTDLILAARERDPTIKGAQIAKSLGVSRQRVAAILKKHGLRTSFTAPHYCACCEKLVTRYPSGWWAKRCDACQASRFQRKQANKWSYFNCEICGASFRRLSHGVAWKAAHNQGIGRWCSRICQARHMVQVTTNRKETT